MHTVPDTLRAYNATTLVVRAIESLVAVMPGAAPVVPYAAMGDVLSVLRPDAAARLPQAEALAVDPVSNALVELGASIDGADRQLARQLLHPPHTDDPHTAQACDATLKALALGSLSRRLEGADPQARAAAFAALPAGQLLMIVWAAIDVVLPLGGTDVAKMVSLHQATEASRLAVIGGERALDGAVAGWAALAPMVQPLVDSASTRTDAITRALAPFVPGLISSPKGASERVAVQSDRMPIYKWLTARLAAEHAVMRASRS